MYGCKQTRLALGVSQASFDMGFDRAKFIKIYHYLFGEIVSLINFTKVRTAFVFIFPPCCGWQTSLFSLLSLVPYVSCLSGRKRSSLTAVTPRIFESHHSNRTADRYFWHKLHAIMLSLRFRIAFAELIALLVIGLCMNARLKIFCHQTNFKICWHASETTGSPSEICRCER